MGTYQKLLTDLQELERYDELLDDIISGRATVVLNRHSTSWERDTMRRLLTTQLNIERAQFLSAIRDRHQLKEIA